MPEDTNQANQFVLKPWIQRGDIAPWWNQGSHLGAFDPVPSRYIVLGFLGTAADPVGQASLQALDAHRRFVDRGKACFFGVSNDLNDRTAQRHIEERFPSVRFLWDEEGTMNRAYGIGRSRLWVILNPLLRVVDVLPLQTDPKQLFRLLDDLPEPAGFLGFEVPPPILILPDVFEPDLCSHLVHLFEHHGGRKTGFMRQIQGHAVEVHDEAWKRRRDYTIIDPILVKHLQARVSRRIVPEMLKVHNFNATRMERHLISCYASDDGSHFGAHRDNVVKATAHRKFALSIILNNDFEGGEISFPEYSVRGYSAPSGSAVVFSGSLLHAVRKVTSGRRYVFLSFLYDEAGERLRDAHNASRLSSASSTQRGIDP